MQDSEFKYFKEILESKGFPIEKDITVFERYILHIIINELSSFQIAIFKVNTWYFIRMS